VRLRRAVAITLAITVALTVVIAAPGGLSIGSVAAAGAADGSPAADVVDYGFADDLGAPAGPLNGAVLGIEAHPTRHGYWVLARDGGVFTYGAARFFGSTGALRLFAPVVGMAAHRGGGYWLVAEDGGIFAYGSARFHGSMGGRRLNEPVIGIAATRSGRGYWLVAQDGGVFAFGDARFHGSLGALPLTSDAVAIAATPTGDGYFVATADGGVFAFGDARFHGSITTAGAAPVADLAVTPRGDGYWLVTVDGAVRAFGAAVFAGSGPAPGRNAVGIARTPEGAGYWVVNVPALPPLPPASGSGRRIVYANAAQRVWLVEADGRPSHSWLVSGHRNFPAPGTYRVFSKVTASTAGGGSLILPYMTRFAVASSGLAVGFHGIPLRRNGTPIQTDAELGQYRSHGCVRMAQDAIKVLYDWAPIGTTVVVLA
jgi:hypothetical protein